LQKIINALAFRCCTERTLYGALTRKPLILKSYISKEDSKHCYLGLCWRMQFFCSFYEYFMECWL